MTTEGGPAPLAPAWWRRIRLWLALAAVVAIGAVLVGALAAEPGRPLDIGSAHKNGSKALAQLLEQYGVTVAQTSSLHTALQAAGHSSVVVSAPDEYSAGQLAVLADAAARMVLAQPGTRAAAAGARGIQPAGVAGGTLHPRCADRGAVAAGPASWPDDTLRYLAGRSGARSCYDGALLTARRLAVVGSAEVFRNDHLAARGVAALDVNAITDSRRLTSVVWLLPGADVAGPGPASIWDLFPPGAGRVVWWAVVVGVLVILWRGRRLGGVVTEPLPVVVHAAELVEGHGRLYARAGARDRAARALRAAAADRFEHRLGLPRGTAVESVAAAVAPIAGRSVGDVTAVLAGPAPVDDGALIHLAQELDELEAVLGGGRKG